MELAIKAESWQLSREGWVEREAAAAWLAWPGRAVTAWLVMSEAPLGPGPGPETIFLMKIITGQCGGCICTHITTPDQQMPCTPL